MGRERGKERVEKIEVGKKSLSEKESSARAALLLLLLLLFARDIARAGASKRPSRVVPACIAFRLCVSGQISTSATFSPVRKGEKEPRRPCAALAERNERANIDGGEREGEREREESGDASSLSLSINLLHRLGACIRPEGRPSRGPATITGRNRDTRDSQRGKNAPF